MISRRTGEYHPASSLTLLIPLRRLLRLERLITADHFESVAKTMIVTTLIVGYAYVVEPFIAWYSGDVVEQQFALWRATGWMAWVYWALAPLNVLIPLAFLFRRPRRNLKTLFVISILVNVGMWLERFFIVVSSTSHDFLPHNWDRYAPTWVEISITVGSFAFFLLWFFGFSKALPTVALSDIKEDALKTGTDAHSETPHSQSESADRGKTGAGSHSALLAVFRQPEGLLEALRKVRQSASGRIETFSPMRLHEAEEILGRGASPVRIWTLAGAMLGMIGGFALAIGSAKVNNLIVGGKFPVSIIPYCIIAFEGAVLLGTIGNLIGLLVHARLGRPALPHGYDARFSRDRFGLLLACPPGELADAKALLSATGPEEIHVSG